MSEFYYFYVPEKFPPVFNISEFHLPWSNATGLVQFLPAIGNHYFWALHTELILGLRPANERRRYYVTTSVIDWAHA